MKRSGLLNAELLGRVGRLGHTDRVVVADCGLPVPADVPVVDLAVTLGLPGWREVLDALLAELVVEGAVVAREAGDGEVGVWVAEREDALGGPPDRVPHERFKELVADASFVVRTGEATPYANILLRCGVPF
ncbi:D-ribose pyranase [Nocardioides rotundus]|uniref:D-ribose pyranase n=1 Tax=Nocardioides rotundus TaxID=1774216 RepID=UPI001CBA809B|nr:D-ribose pyranase [Nocardioides rotundus]UAL30309.1 D-ribose pyranase [Nocardioides rotundus]